MVREALGRLVKRGVSAAWQPSMRPLLALPAVRRELGRAADADAPEILRKVLVDALGGIADPSYRRLLTIVLGLDETYDELSVADRRELAGRVFRGGERRVGIGTIRQHHEPRALDELATVLLQGDGGSTGRSGGRSDGGRAFEWHPLVHQQWAEERLSLWRLAFSSYERNRVVARLRLIMDEAGVMSWSMDELFGVHDALIRAWVPRRYSDFDDVLMTGLAGEDLLSIERFDVDQFVGESRPILRRMPGELGAALTSELLRLEDGHADDALLSRYLNEGLISISPRRLEPEVGVVVAIGGVMHLQRSTLEAHTARLFDLVQHSALRGAAFYKGVGFATFVVDGHAGYSEFGQIEALIAEMREEVRMSRLRVTAFITSNAQPVARYERLAQRFVESSPNLSVMELLLQGEGAMLEVKASAFRRPPELRQHGQPEEEDSRQTTQRLMRALAGMLNGEGGTIVLGVAQGDAYDGGSADVFPRVGSWMICGIDHELDRDRDHFISRLMSRCSDAIEPDPLPFLHFSTALVEGRTVCTIEVAHADRWFWERSSRRTPATFWVRQGAMTRQLSGVDVDDYRSMKPRG